MFKGGVSWPIGAPEKENQQRLIKGVLFERRLSKGSILMPKCEGDGADV